MSTFRRSAVGMCALLAACGGRVSVDGGNSGPVIKTTSTSGTTGPSAGVTTGSSTSGTTGSTGDAEGGHAGSGGSGAGGAGSGGSTGSPGIGDGPRGPVTSCPPGEQVVLLDFASRGDGTWELLSIDPETAVASSYPTPGTTNVLAGLASTTGFPVFDVQSHRIHVRGISDTSQNTSRLFTVDSRTGQVLGSPVIQSPHAPSWLATSGDGVLLGLVWNDTAEELRRVDPLSGNCIPYPDPTSPRTLPGMLWISGATFNPVANHLYVSGGGMPPDQLFTVDMKTATVLADPVRQPMYPQYFAVNRNGTLVSMAWTGSREELRSMDPATGLQTGFPVPDAPYVVAGLETLTGIPVIDNDAGRIYIAGTVFGSMTPHLFVMDAFGHVPSRALPTTRIFDMLVVACR